MKFTEKLKAKKSRIRIENPAKETAKKKRNL